MLKVTLGLDSETGTVMTDAFELLLRVMLWRDQVKITLRLKVSPYLRSRGRGRALLVGQMPPSCAATGELSESLNPLKPTDGVLGPIFRNFHPLS